MTSWSFIPLTLPRDMDESATSKAAQDAVSKTSNASAWEESVVSRTTLVPRCMELHESAFSVPGVLSWREDIKQGGHLQLDRCVCDMWNSFTIAYILWCSFNLIAVITSDNANLWVNGIYGPHVFIFILFSTPDLFCCSSIIFLSQAKIHRYFSCSWTQVQIFYHLSEGTKANINRPYKIFTSLVEIFMSYTPHIYFAQ